MDTTKNNKKTDIKNEEEIVVVSDSLEEAGADPRDEKIASLEDQLKRAVADYRNLERRSFDERMDAVKYANKKLMEALLPAFDTLFLADKFTTDENVKMTIVRILEILKENGIEKVDTNDVNYNADTMEVLEVVDGKDEKVIEEVRPGFKIHGKLIRPAQVKVGGVKN